jgi:hypothetical protein
MGCFNLVLDKIQKDREKVQRAQKMSKFWIYGLLGIFVMYMIPLITGLIIMNFLLPGIISIIVLGIFICTILPGLWLINKASKYM